MTNRTTTRSRTPNFFDEKRELLPLSSLHNWLLIFACVMIFLVLPLLFVWSSLGMIHTRVYGQVAYLPSMQHKDTLSHDRTKHSVQRDQ